MTTQMDQETIADVNPEVKPDSDKARVCEIIFTIMIARWLKWPKWSRRCNRPATWSSLMMCCGHTGYVCNYHANIAKTYTTDQMETKCHKCGAINAQILWSRL